jgi:hypothetical protein
VNNLTKFWSVVTTAKTHENFRKDLFRVKRSYWYFLPKFPEQLEETEITCKFHLAQMDNVPDLLQNKVPMRLHSCPAGFIIAVNLL